MSQDQAETAMATRLVDVYTRLEEIDAAGRFQVMGCECGHTLGQLACPRVD
jgi:hypothetical protein